MPSVKEEPKRRLFDLYPDRVDVVDQPANKNKFLIVKKKGETDELNGLLVDGEVDLDSNVFIAKADTKELQAVNAALQILRPVARGVDGDARTSLVRVIRLLELGFGISSPSTNIQTPVQPNNGGEVTTPAEMKKSENEKMTEQEIKDLVAKSVATAVKETISEVEKAKMKLEEEQKAKIAADAALSSNIKKAVEEVIAPMKAEIDEIKKAQMGGQASASGDPVPTPKDAGQVREGKMPPAGSSSTTVAKGAGVDGMGEGIEQVAKSETSDVKEIDEIRKSVGDLTSKVEKMFAAITSGNGNDTTESTKVEKGKNTGSIWSNVVGSGR